MKEGSHAKAENSITLAEEPVMLAEESSHAKAKNPITLAEESSHAKVENPVTQAVGSGEESDPEATIKSNL